MDIYSTSTQRGFILITVLFFLLMIALMAMSLLNASHLELRLSQNYAMASQQFWAAEAGLKRAEAQVVARQENDRWQGVFNYAGYLVHYEVKRLDLPFCNDQQLVIYYHISAEAKQAQRNPLVLQTTYAKRTQKKCNGDQAKRLTEGRSSWRELNNVM